MNYENIKNRLKDLILNPLLYLVILDYILTQIIIIKGGIEFNYFVSDVLGHYLSLIFSIVIVLFISKGYYRKLFIVWYLFINFRHVLILLGFTLNGSLVPFFYVILFIFYFIPLFRKKCDLLKIYEKKNKG